MRSPWLPATSVWSTWRCSKPESSAKRFLSPSNGAGRLDYVSPLVSLPAVFPEAPLLEQERLRANLRARELELSINLIRALGGGFADASAGPAS